MDSDVDDKKKKVLDRVIAAKLELCNIVVDLERAGLTFESRVAVDSRDILASIETRIRDTEQIGG